MLSNKVGTFLILVGLTLIGLYVLSDIAKAPACGFFIYGTILLLLGIALWLRNPTQPAQPTGRFRILQMLGKKPAKKK